MNATKTLYRVDEYYRNFGTLLYITFDKPSYNWHIQITEDEADKIGAFIQVTEFTCPSGLFGMDAWVLGEVVSTTCYQIDQN